MDERTLAANIDDLPALLAVWHDGPAALPRLLAMCIGERLREAAALDHGPAGRLNPRDRADHNDRWRHAVATVITWHTAYGQLEPSPVPPSLASRTATPRNKAAARRARRRVGRPPAKPRGPGASGESGAGHSQGRAVTTQDYIDAVELAAAWWELDTLRVGLRTGDISVAGRDGRHARLKNNRRADIEVLDIVLAQVTVVPESARAPFASPLVLPAPGFGPDRVDQLTRWLQDQVVAPPPPRGMGPRHPMAHRIVNAIPKRLRDQAWTQTENDLRAQGTTVPETTDLGGITLAAARTCYAFLISQLHINFVAGLLLGTPEMFLWAIRPEHLLRALRTRVTNDHARAFVDLCTYTSGRSPGSAPLLMHQGQVLIAAELVSPIAFERTLLRAASADPGRSGRLGNVLGERGSRWSERFATIAGCDVATELKIRDHRGRSAGDLDVVARDRNTDELLIVETKWPVDAATLAESNKVDAAFDKGRGQLHRIRTGLAEGTLTIDWPPGWDTPGPATTIHWWVGSAQQLDSRVQPEDGITTTSLRLVEQLLPATSLDDLITRLRTFPVPREGVEYQLIPAAVSAGHLRLTYPAIQIAHGSPEPPPHRRTSLGWT